VNDRNEDDIQFRLAALASLAPTIQETHRVLESARRAVNLRRRVRWSVGVGIAAMIGGILIIAGIALSPHAASAADALARSAQASAQFQGWIHIRTDSEGDKELEVQHINNQSGAMATTSVVNGVLDVEMALPDQLELLHYDGASHELKIGPITQESAKGWKATTKDFPLTIAACLAEVPGIEVRQTAEGKLLRFDLTLPPDDPAKAAQENRTLYPAAAVVWTDPETGLIQKGTTIAEGKSVKVEVTYGDPIIRDIFDVGVPRDAKVIDLRPVPDVVAFEERLKKRSEGGFGDYAALCTRVETFRTKGQTPVENQEIEIYGALGLAWVADIFPIDGHPSRKLDGDSADLPDWPTPALDRAIAFLRNRTPGFFFTSDGETAWRDYASAGSAGRSIKITKPPTANLEYQKGMFTLPGLLWPVNQLTLFGTDGKIERLSDPAHSGLFGLKLDRPYFMNAPDDTRLVETYWFDPAKDDLAVDCTEIYTSIATGKISRQSHRVCSDFLQTENGRWYPSRIKSESILNFSGGSSQEQSCDWYLKVSTVKKLGPEWFTDPAARGTTKP